MDIKLYIFLIFLVGVGIGILGGKSAYKKLRKWKESQKRENYLRGRNWAKAEFEKGKTMEQILLTSDNPWDSDEFERGALDWCLNKKTQEITAKVSQLKRKD